MCCSCPADTVSAAKDMPGSSKKLKVLVAGGKMNDAECDRHVPKECASGERAGGDVVVCVRCGPLSLQGGDRNASGVAGPRSGLAAVRRGARLLRALLLSEGCVHVGDRPSSSHVDAHAEAPVAAQAVVEVDAL